MDLCYHPTDNSLSLDRFGEEPLNEPLTLCRHRLDKLGLYISTGIGNIFAAHFGKLTPYPGETLKWKIELRLLDTFDGDPLFSFDEDQVTFDSTLQRYVLSLLPASDALDIALGRASAALDVTGIETDTVTIDGTAPAIGQGVIFSSLTGGTGLTVDTRYYVVARPTAATIKIALTAGGTAITVGSSYSAATMTRDSEDVSEVDCKMQIVWSRTSGDAGTWEGPDPFAVTLLNNVVDVAAA